jgi:hypothetical protein
MVDAEYGVFTPFKVLPGDKCRLGEPKGNSPGRVTPHSG